MANGAIFIPVSELNLCQEYDPVVVCESKFLASLSFVKSNFFNIVFLCWPIDWPFALPASQQASVLATAGHRRPAWLEPCFPEIHFLAYGQFCYRHSSPCFSTSSCMTKDCMTKTSKMESTAVVLGKQSSPHNWEKGCGCP